MAVGIACFFLSLFMDFSAHIKAALFGVAVGDALGVPVEFKSRATIRQNPVRDMIGYGTYNLPPGTFSDDSSMTFCLAEALAGDFSLDALSQNFIRWRYHNDWTPLGEVFDIGIATRQAISRLHAGEIPELAGGMEVNSNGNGSLMRILPLVFHLWEQPVEARYACTRQVSSLTHAHVRSAIACFYYLEFARLILGGKGRREAYRQLQHEFPQWLSMLGIVPEEQAVFDRLLRRDISALPEDEIASSGYVVHTLEASIWCLLTTTNYAEAVLKAVNLGDDTDTTAAVTGGLAGLCYGMADIPAHWVAQMARRADIEDLAARMARRISR
jgi:ADP-ribosyl-[dinitrogen reductase] hydrolase